MSAGEVEVIRERAESFLRNADHLIRVKDWDLATFNLEQYCQLILKYKLLIKTGSYPRTHSLRELLKRLEEFNPTVSRLTKGEERLLYVTKLEDAYIVSRYLPRKYTEDEVLALQRFVKGVFSKVVSKV